MAGHKVLTIDDDLATRRLIRLILELEGLEVLEAVNGHEGLEIIQQEPVDLVLLDVNMPGLNGWDVLRSLRGTVPLSDLPAIMVSGEQPDSNLVRELKPNDYFRKPFDVEELAERVKELLDDQPPSACRNCA